MKLIKKKVIIIINTIKNIKKNLYKKITITCTLKWWILLMFYIFKNKTENQEYRLKINKN